MLNITEMIALLYQELHGLALREQQNPVSYPSSVRQRPDEELRKDSELRSTWMVQTLSYLDDFWDGLFLYRKDGPYPMSNNLAERSHRSFTSNRKFSLYFGSDEGVEMSVIFGENTCLHGANKNQLIR